MAFLPNPEASECRVKSLQVDGKEINTTVKDAVTGRLLFVAPDALFKSGGKHEMTVQL